MGAFAPPVAAAGDTCYISDHTDIGIGMNAKSPNAEAARTFLEWVGSPEFAALYANALPGFFSLNSTAVEMSDPLAQEFVSWRETCQSTIRSTYQILSRGTPNLENETWNASANVIRGTETPEDAAPTMPDTPSEMRDVADWVAMLVVVSPESACVTETFSPAAASLMSLTARSTPAISGGPRVAREPVWGRIEPILRSRPSAEPESPDSPELASEPLEQAERARAAAAPTAQQERKVARGLRAGR